MGCNGAGEPCVLQMDNRSRPPAEPCRSSPDPTHPRRDPTLIGSPPRIPSCSACPSWFRLFFTATVTRPQVLRPRSPARCADSPLPMNSLPDVACFPASSRKDPTGADGPLDAGIVIRDERSDIGRPSRYDSPDGVAEPNAASDRTPRETNFPVNRSGRQRGL